jgi:hypothetical protein
MGGEKMTVKEILVKWLINNGYDGLCRKECFCTPDDLMPCGEGFADCEPGKKCSEKCDHCDTDIKDNCESEDYDYMMFPVKEAQKGKSNDL